MYLLMPYLAQICYIRNRKGEKMRELVLLFVLLTALFWGYHGMAKIDNFLNDVRKDRHGQNTQKQCVRESKEKKAASSYQAGYEETAS